MKKRYLLLPALLLIAYLLYVPDEINVQHKKTAVAQPVRTSSKPSLAKDDAVESAKVSGNESLTKQEQFTVHAQIQKARCWFTQVAKRGAKNHYAAFPTYQNFVFEANADGVSVQPERGAWSWKMKLKGSNAVAPRAVKEKITYSRSDGVDEWFVNGDHGVEHGFTLARATNESKRTFALTVDSTLSAVANPDGVGVTFVDSDLRPQLHYDGLYAHDADGKKLAATVEVSGKEIILAVETSGARFPVTLDPLISLSGTVVRPDGGGLPSDAFGSTMDYAEDVLAVAAPSTNSRGNVHIYQRSPECEFSWDSRGLLAIPNIDLVKFGHSISVGPSSIAVTAVGGADPDSLTDRVYIYGLNRDTGNLAAVEEKVISMGRHDAAHQLVVSSDSKADWVAVGDPGYFTYGSSPAIKKGRVSIYHRDKNGAHQWGLVKVLDCPEEVDGANFGAAICISYQRIAVSATGLGSAGKVFIYAWNAVAEDWLLEDTILPPDAPPGQTIEGFGSKLALSNTWLAIGAPTSDLSAELMNAGCMALAKRLEFGDAGFGSSGANWVTGIMHSPTPHANEYFGSSLSMNGKKLTASGTMLNAPGEAQMATWHKTDTNYTDLKKRWVLIRQDSPYSMGLSNQISDVLQMPDAVLASNTIDVKVVARRLTTSHWPAQAYFQEGGVAHKAGAALARDEDLLVMSAPGQEAGRDPSVYILRRVEGAAPGDEWVVASILSNPTEGFGESLALKHNALLVGSPNHGDGTGEVFVYLRENAEASAWSSPITLAPPSTFPADDFGKSIAFNGVFAIIGDPAANAGMGGIVIFARKPNAWDVVEQHLGNAVTNASDLRGYGASVAIAEDYTIMIGAPDTLFGTSEIPLGAAVIWRYIPRLNELISSSSFDVKLEHDWDWQPRWIMEQVLRPQNVPSNELAQRCGTSVALNNYYALAGAPGENGLHGRVHVWSYNQSNTSPWSKTAELTSDHGSDGDAPRAVFGQSIAINDLFAAIGSPGTAVERGEVFIYRLPERYSNSWKPMARLVNPCGGMGDDFGTVVTAPYADDISVSALGHGVHIFSHDTKNWQLVNEVPEQSPNETISFAMGASLALDDNLLAVAGPRHKATEFDLNGAPLVIIGNYPQTYWQNVFLLQRVENVSDAWEMKQVIAVAEEYSVYEYPAEYFLSQHGTSIELSGHNLIIGSISDHPDETGSALIVQIPPTGNLNSDQNNAAFSWLAKPPNVRNFGRQVTICGRYAAVSSKGFEDQTVYPYVHHPAKVVIYKNIGKFQDTNETESVIQTRKNIWVPVHEITGRAQIDNQGDFGSDLALDGYRLIVGAATERLSGSGNARDGSVSIYERDYPSWGSWGKTQEIYAYYRPEIISKPPFSGTVALEGNTLVIGAYEAAEQDELEQYAHVFEHAGTGAGAWTYSAELHSGVSPRNSLPVSVAISGNMIAVGRPGDIIWDWSLSPPSIHIPGEVRIFHRYNTQLKSDTILAHTPNHLRWGRITTIHPESNDPTHTFHFGASVALDGETLAVGAPGRHFWYGTYYDENGELDALFHIGEDSTTRTPGRVFIYSIKTPTHTLWDDLEQPDMLPTIENGIMQYSNTESQELVLDLDGDGLNSLLERFHGLNPFKSDAGSAFINTYIDAATGELVVSWREAIDHGLTATPEWSRDLNGWHISGAGPTVDDVKVITVNTIFTGENHLIREARMPSDSNGRAFLRLSVQDLASDSSYNE